MNKEDNTIIVAGITAAVVSLIVVSRQNRRRNNDIKRYNKALRMLGKEVDRLNKITNK